MNGDLTLNLPIDRMFKTEKLLVKCLLKLVYCLQGFDPFLTGGRCLEHDRLLGRLADDSFGLLLLGM